MIRPQQMQIRPYAGEPEVVYFGRGLFRLSLPNISKILVGVLAFFSILITWRAAAYLAHAVHYMITDSMLLSDGFRQVDTLGALSIATRWIVVTTLLLSIIGAITHFSPRIYIRLNAQGLAKVVSSLVIWQLGAALLVYWVKTKSGQSLDLLVVSIVSAAAGFSMIAAGAKQFAHARQMMILSADAVVRSDHRPAILYLRSFIDDDRDAPESSADPVHTFPLSDRAFFPGFWINRRRLSFEEILCVAMQKIGPVIAIGRPGEHLPRLGAARKYVDDLSWQTEVLKIFESSRFVCLVVGLSRGLQWELRTVLSRGDPKKIVLILPQDTRASNLWRTLMTRVNGSISDGILPAHVPDDTLAIAFRTNWHPVIMTGRPSKGNYRKIGQLMANQTIGDS